METRKECVMAGCRKPALLAVRGGPRNPKLTNGQYLCQTHNNQLYISGWNLAQMQERWTPMCFIPECGREATALDHDHSCCDSGLYRRKRCGGCNRGFVCAHHNREIGIVERSPSLRAGHLMTEEVQSVLLYLDHFKKRVSL